MGTQPPPQKGGGDPNFRSMFIVVKWPDGSKIQNGTWHGGGPWSRPRCIRRGPSFRERGITVPPFRPMSIVATVAHLSYC